MSSAGLEPTTNSLQTDALPLSYEEFRRGGTRTRAWRHQKSLPYHLATLLFKNIKLYWGREDLNLQEFNSWFTVYRDNRSATSSNTCFWLESNHITTFAELHSCHLNYRRKIRVAGLEPQSSIPKTDALTYYATPCSFKRTV